MSTSVAHVDLREAPIPETCETSDVAARYRAELLATGDIPWSRMEMLQIFSHMNQIAVLKICDRVDREEFGEAVCAPSEVR